ncbi:hypothetical protein NCCP1664_25330 [Zafaria cholistanensis]|uniref:Fluoride-specific ion channel FluC n=1 Tax=Zafaria cholistanensis TaxID=1682741 RepID=A0A5A7NVD2_9MICC|nr:CrcB family protein [Zafaria cholistanensis]GER24038.1 hypothetical protein NCCP1664_25330 [Zafaria cholistanensis]
MSGLGLALAVGLAGAAGSVLRALSDRAALRLQTAVRRHRGLPPEQAVWPWGTLAVNAAGSLLMGFVVARLMAGDVAHPAGTVLVAGLCGGLTTFSSFTVGTVGLWKQGRRLAAAANVAANLAAGIALAGAGLRAGGFSGGSSGVFWG